MKRYSLAAVKGILNSCHSACAAETDLYDHQEIYIMATPISKLKWDKENTITIAAK